MRRVRGNPPYRKFVVGIDPRSIRRLTACSGNPPYRKFVVGIDPLINPQMKG
jgi:hypothetical protein